MPGTAIDAYLSAREEQRERTRLEARRQETGVILIRFDDQMSEVSCFDEARERAIWAEACQIVEMMRDQVDRQGRRPMRIVTILAPEQGPVYRCSFGWEFGGSPQIGDTLLSLFALSNRYIDASERAAHMDFLARHSCDEAARQYWKQILTGHEPPTPVFEQIRRQAATETSPRVRPVATSSPGQPTNQLDIQEI